MMVITTCFLTTSNEISHQIFREILSHIEFVNAVKTVNTLSTVNTVRTINTDKTVDTVNTSKPSVSPGRLSSIVLPFFSSTRAFLKPKAKRFNLDLALVMLKQIQNVRF